MPKSTHQEMELTWRPPATVNAFERLRARSTHVAYCLMTAYTSLLQGFEALRRSDAAMSRPFEIRDGIGVGLWEAGRGTLTHHAAVEDARLRNYQILTPSTWMAGPRDPWGTPGPYEEAARNTPILEEIRDPDDFVGIDILRAIRSFDPCLPCAVHMDTGAGTIIREATSCACGAD